jgi:hypothetical protein
MNPAGRRVMRPQIFRTHAMRMGIDLRGTFLEWRQLVDAIFAASNRFRACCQLRHCERRVMIAAKDASLKAGESTEQ